MWDMEIIIYSMGKNPQVPLRVTIINQVTWGIDLRCA